MELTAITRKLLDEYGLSTSIEDVLKDITSGVEARLWEILTGQKSALEVIESYIFENESKLAGYIISKELSHSVLPDDKVTVIEEASFDIFVEGMLMQFIDIQSMESRLHTSTWKVIFDDKTGLYYLYF